MWSKHNIRVIEVDEEIHWRIKISKIIHTNQNGVADQPATLRAYAENQTIKHRVPGN